MVISRGNLLLDQQENVIINYKNLDSEKIAMTTSLLMIDEDR
jgi:hypothetical protein